MTNKFLHTAILFDIRTILFVILLFEMFVILFVLDQASIGILGGDGRFYDETATNLVNSGTFGVSNGGIVETTFGKTPGYSFYVAFIYLFSGSSIIAFRISQFILFWFVGLCVYRLAAIFCDKNVAEVSAILTLTYFPLVFLPIYHLSELLATCLVVWSVYKAIEWQNTGRKLDILLASFVFGFLILVRPNWAMLSIPILAMFYFSKEKWTKR